MIPEERQKKIDAMKASDAELLGTEHKDRQERVEKGLDLDDAIVAGVRDPETQHVRETDDLSMSMDYNQRQQITLLKLMQDIQIDAISEIDAIIARFHRVL